MRRDPGSWLPQPFSFHPWVALGGRLGFHSSWSLSQKGLGTPLPLMGSRGPAPRCPSPSLGSEISMEGMGSLIGPKSRGLPSPN